MNGEEKQTDESKLKLGLKRIGAAGFTFFLIKGLIWVLIAAVAYYHAKN